jgi:hypothetical protein
MGRCVRIAVLLAALLVVHPAGPAAGAGLPSRLSAQAFWQLSQDSSEGGGFFRGQNITNLTSNEQGLQDVIPDLLHRVGTGGVYLGVGPEQNFTYIAALEPRVAVIFDIRRGNLDLQLMYKAMFEMAGDRAGFISVLFSKPQPAGLDARSTATDLFRAFASSTPSDELYARNLAAIEARLTRTDGLPVPADDLAGLEAVYQAFYREGYAVRASPTYAELMTATNTAGVARSFLSTEARFAVVRDLEVRNLLVPVVGDFAGPKAIRAIGAYLKAHDAVVSVFYLSNVEQYLEQYGTWDIFCRNVATLPLDARSTFIRSVSGRGGGSYYRRPGFTSSLGLMLDEVRGCGSAK